MDSDADFQFSAPSFHDFGTDYEQETNDDGYFDRLRKSTIQQRAQANEAEVDEEFGLTNVAFEATDEGNEQEGSFEVSDDEDDGVEAEVAVPFSTVATYVENAGETTADDDNTGVTSVGTLMEANTTNQPLPDSDHVTEYGQHDEEYEEETEGEEDCNPTAPETTGVNVLASTPTSTGTQDNQRKRKASESSQSRGKQPVQLTVPQTPHLRVLKRTRSDRILSSTSRELALIQQERELLRKQKEQYEKMYNQVKTTAPPVAVNKSVKPLTKPVEVTLRVDSRVRPEDVHPVEPFQSFAEKVMSFCSSIGHSLKNAFLTSPSTNTGAGNGTAVTGQHKLTEPEPFKLATDELASRRGHHIASQQELEEQYMKEIKPFKARPLDPRVLNSAGDVGVARVPRKPLTTPEPFALESERLHKKAQVAAAKAFAEEQEETRKASQFKAAPVPVAVKVPEALPKPAPKPPTHHTAVVLSTDVRACDRDKYEAEKAARLAEAERIAKENARIRQAREEAEVKELRRAASFKAAPYHKPTSPQKSLRSVKQVTCPLTPHLETTKRATRSQQQQQQHGLAL